MACMIPPGDVVSRAELRAVLTRRQLKAAVDDGHVVRARRDHYVSGDAPPEVCAAVRIGGRVGCLSRLQQLGIFVFENGVVHVHVARGGTRLRSPHDRAVQLAPQGRRGAVLHWWPLVDPPGEPAACVGVVDALIQAVRCQLARHAIASLDSALNQKLISRVDLRTIFGALPARYQVLRKLVDERAQSGTETLVRLMLRSLGVDVKLQVRFDGVGFVDLLVNDWLVIECDSKQFHSEWSQQVKDRERDLALAQLGHPTLRVTAAQILHRPDQVRAAIRALLASR